LGGSAEDEDTTSWLENGIFEKETAWSPGYDVESEDQDCWLASGVGNREELAMQKVKFLIEDIAELRSLSAVLSALDPWPYKRIVNLILGLQ
jgi:hypothetical protein